MATKRFFNKLNEKEKIGVLMVSLVGAMREHPDLTKRGFVETDLIGSAVQHGGCYRLKRSDFNMISDMKVQDIIDMFNVGYKK
jgi:hypothetical protein